MAGSGYRFKLRQDVLANQPLATASPLAFYNASDSGELYFSDGAAWLGMSIPRANPTLFVATTGSDTAAGTVGAPLLTIGEALRRLSGGYSGIARIVLAAGTYAQGDTKTLYLPEGVGANALPLVIDGATVDSGLGTRTVNGAGTQGSGVTFGSLTDLTGGLVVNAWAGYTLKCVSGTVANIGKEFQIVSNTATVFTIAGAFAAQPANSDTFVVIKPASKITFTTQLEVRAQSGLVFNHCEVAGAGGGTDVLLLSGNVQLYASMLSSAVAMTVTASDSASLRGGAGGAALPTALSALIGTSPAGFSVMGVATSINSATGQLDVQARQCVFASGRFGTDAPVAFFAVSCGFVLGANAIASAGGFLGLVTSRMNGATPGGALGGVAVTTGGFAQFVTVDVSGTVANAGVTVTNGGADMATVTSATAANGGAQGLLAGILSRVKAAGGSNTVLGSGGAGAAVKVGILAAGTWATIDVPATATSSDFGNANPQYAIVR